MSKKLWLKWRIYFLKLVVGFLPCFSTCNKKKKENDKFLDDVLKVMLYSLTKLLQTQMIKKGILPLYFIFPYFIDLIISKEICFPSLLQTKSLIPHVVYSIHFTLFFTFACWSLFKQAAICLSFLPCNVSHF